MAILEFRFWISDLMSSVFSVPLCETIRENDRSEVIGANRYWGSDVSITNTPVLGQQYSYEYDPIGNRISGGRASSQAVYDSNELNQYVSRTVPSTASVIGSALANVDVYVNGESVERQGNYWHSVVTVNNVPSPVYAEIEILGVLEPVNQNDPPEYSITTNHVFVAQSPELFEYDLDGNLTKDGRFNYTWNAENRLITVETRDDLPPEVPRHRIDYAYDHQGRMVFKEVSDVSNNCKLKTINFLWDNWNIISETTVSSTPNSSLLTTNSISYVWGRDLSGKLQGAGGVGGLLAVIRDDETYYPTYDANGNISEYIASDGTIAAHYEYDAFGNTIVEYNPLLKGGGGNAAGGLPFSFRFSTKYRDNETGLYYYGYRFYKPEWERWLNRDPIKERGGRNLYGFIGNSSLNGWDVLGMTFAAEKPDPTKLLPLDIARHDSDGWVQVGVKEDSLCNPNQDGSLTIILTFYSVWEHFNPFTAEATAKDGYVKVEGSDDFLELETNNGGEWTKLSKMEEWPWPDGQQQGGPVNVSKYVSWGATHEKNLPRNPKSENGSLTFTVVYSENNSTGLDSFVVEWSYGCKCNDKEDYVIDPPFTFSSKLSRPEKGK